MSNRENEKMRAGLFRLGEEDLLAENKRLRLVIALLKHVPAKAKGGRPKTRPDADSVRAELEQERERLQRRDGKRYTWPGVWREMAREIGKQKGGSPEAIERWIESVKFRQNLKSLQNQLAPGKTSRKPKRTNNGKK